MFGSRENQNAIAIATEEPNSLQMMEKSESIQHPKLSRPGGMKELCMHAHAGIDRAADVPRFGFGTTMSCTACPA